MQVVDAQRVLAAATAVAGASSIAATLTVRIGQAGVVERDVTPWLIVEPLALGVLVALVVRWSTPRPAVVCGSLAALGSALWVQRFLQGVPAPTATAASAGWLLLPLTMGILGWYLRWSETVRTRAVAMTKTEQRLGLAIHLHDYVTHDISEIVARAQAGTAVLPLGDPRVVELLAQIEAAGLRALESMDQTVRALSEDVELAHVERGGIDDIEELVRRFDAVSDVSADVVRRPTGRVGAEVGAEAYRTVVEALTNVRRHATRVSEVTVGLCRSGDRLFVSITDDGDTRHSRRGRSGATATSAGGLGLAAMTQRVQQLGGNVEVGPRRPRGWRVTATLPLSGRAEQGVKT